MLPSDERSAASGSPADAQRFVEALLTIYKHARAAAGTGPPPPERPKLVDAAATVQSLKPEFGEYWRRLAIAKLAASGIQRPDFQEAIVALGIQQPESLTTVLPAHIARLLVIQRFVNIYDYLRRSESQYDNQGVPSCPYTTPQTIPGPPPDAWSATATTTVFLGLTPPQLAIRADPQNWDNPCGKPFFESSYTTDISSNGTFSKTGCVATEGISKASDVEWHGFSYEHFIMPTFAGDFFDNILHIDHVPTATEYSLTYSLESSLCGQIAPDLQAAAPLFVDGGSLVGTDAGGGQVYVTATKTIGFNNVFPHHPPANLASDAGAALELLGDGLPYWLCCPK